MISPEDRVDAVRKACGCGNWTCHDSAMLEAIRAATLEARVKAFEEAAGEFDQIAQCCECHCEDEQAGVDWADDATEEEMACAACSARFAAERMRRRAGEVA